MHPRAGDLDQSIDVKTEDEIGQLAAGFNRMVVQLRDNQRVARRRLRTSWQRENGSLR
jgi:nitrogen fixation/metabolism regulation signal transduction histidine kinase